MASPRLIRSAMVKDSEDEEALYKSLSDASHGCYSIDQVRLIRRVFDRADKDGDGFVDHNELEQWLLQIGNEVSTRVLKAVLDAEQGKLSFHHFVDLMRHRLSEDEALQLMAMEEEYIKSMGIDEEEQRQMEAFRQGRDSRRSSRIEFDAAPHDPAPRVHHPPHSSKPNDVDEYKHEFGLDD